MRVLALDLGSKRIGVAVSDRAGRSRPPTESSSAPAPEPTTTSAIGELVAEWGAERVVVGLPLSWTATTAPRPVPPGEEVAELARDLAVPVETYDERLTTVTARAPSARQKMTATHDVGWSTRWQPPSFCRPGSTGEPPAADEKAPKPE